MKKNAGQIIRRYAAALFESANEASAVAPIAEHAEALAQALTPEVLSFFVNPVFADAVKLETLRELSKSVGAHAVLTNFLALLLANGRFVVTAEVLREFLRLADEKLGVARVDLVTPRAIGDDEAKEFEKALSDALQKKVVISRKIDAGLKAGYVVKIGNTVVDASLKSRLQGLKESLSQGV
ncbi:MAG: ATP synthase F1 subunit delta [Silvanigrellales bacterium]|jgi:F-type H+-transporting ATPase subunit delta|nr:ATP synthase F1 subunit delta [Silvanigrellales bacterium]